MAKMKKKTFREKMKYYLFSKQNVFVWIFLVIMSFFKRGNIYRSHGTHLISGYPGSGKTLLANALIQDIDKTKYFCLSNIKEFNDVKTFDIKEIFKNNEMVKQFPLTDEKGRKLYAIIFDEINLNFNKRLNRRADYNDIFLGLIEFLVTHRHQGVPRVYFIGQKLELQDTQLQSLFKYQHDIIRTNKKPFYWLYKQNKFVTWAPKKLGIVNRVKDLDDSFIEFNYDGFKIKRYHLETYNTHALADNYKQLPFATLKP